MSKELKKYLITVGVAVFIYILHLILLYWLAEKNIVSVILSAGEHTPKFAIFLAMTFIIIRVIAIVFLPAILLHDSWIMFMNYMARKKDRDL
ncbi:MAG: hypothetical protein ABRQ37_15200 [Candidatus Eremiobacterota bacterium]